MERFHYQRESKGNNENDKKIRKILKQARNPSIRLINAPFINILSFRGKNIN